MPLPRPELGLVVHYGFVWSGTDRPPLSDYGKDRPCMIVNLVEEVESPDRSVLRVVYLPISHVAPSGGERAVPIPSGVAGHLGLSSERSYLYLSYACEDDWPFDIARVPGSRRFHYGFIPPALFKAIASGFKSYLAERPEFVHKR